MEARVLSATVSKEVDRWFVSLSGEVEIPDLIPVQGEIVGINVGNLKKFTRNVD